MADATIRQLALAYLKEATPENAMAMTTAILDQVPAPPNCTGEPCPHCGEKLPRMNIIRDGVHVHVQISDTFEARGGIKGLISLLKSYVDSSPNEG